MGIEEQGIVVKQSRISYINNYLLVALVLFFFLLSWSRFGLVFTLSPGGFEEVWKTVVVSGFAVVVVFLIKEPVIERWFRYYVITNNEVILTEGILRKNRIIIPYQSISNVDVYKGIIGRILDFGDVSVVGFKNQIIMRGVSEPELFYRIINNKISVMRGTSQVVVREEVRPKRKFKKVKIEGWDDQEKTLKKKLEKEKKRKKSAKKTKKRRWLSLKRRKKIESEE
jgi:membrane protein YdbS with pleckstrin-like domain